MRKKMSRSQYALKRKMFPVGQMSSKGTSKSRYVERLAFQTNIDYHNPAHKGFIYSYRAFVHNFLFPVSVALTSPV